jgi:hypothetical protein
MDMTCTSYAINMTDSEDAPEWLHICETQQLGPQDSGRVAMRVTVQDGFLRARLERELERDENVIEYHEVEE